MALRAELAAVLARCSITRPEERAERLCDPEDGGLTDWADLLRTSDVLLIPYIPPGLPRG